MGIDVPKQLLSFGGKTVLETAVLAFASRNDIDAVFVIAPRDGSLDDTYREKMAPVSAEYGKDIIIARGGEERSGSVIAGLDKAAEYAAGKGMSPGDVMVMIHDAARPGITDEIIDSCMEAMEHFDAAAAAVPSRDSVRMISEIPLKGEAPYPIITSAHVDRRLVYMMQTPQTYAPLM